MRLLLITILGISAIHGLAANSFEDEFHRRFMAAGETWEAKWANTLDTLGAYSGTEQMIVLGHALRACGNDPNTRGPTRQKILERAQSTLLAIPGHAKYYENKIEAMRVEVLASDGARAVLSEEEARERQHREVEAVSEWTYINYCEATAFPTLALLPSPETVAVLGRFLEDPEGRDGKTLLGGEMNGGDQDFEARRSNAEYATMAIRVLGIEHPPARAPAIRNWESAAPEEVDAWKDWWQEVKSGQRTYRFVGSTTENGPVGPVSAEMLQAIERDRRRDGDRAAGHRPVPPTVAVPPRSAGGVQSRNFGILAAAAIIAALWYFLRARNARPV